MASSATNAGVVGAIFGFFLGVFVAPTVGPLFSKAFHQLGGKVGYAYQGTGCGCGR